MYLLEVYVRPNTNPFHPEGGWLKVAEDTNLNRILKLRDIGIIHGNPPQYYKISSI